VQGDRVVVGCIWIDHRKPCVIFQINWNGCDLSQKEIVFLQHLCVRLQSRLMNGAFWKKDAIAVVVTGVRRQAREEFAE